LAVLASMGWWAATLIGARWPYFAMPPAPSPAGWAHAIAMQYQVLPLFVFGFLLTVMPRWTNTQPYAARHYLPVSGTLLLGYLVTLAGLFGSAALLAAGIAISLVGWLVGLVLLALTVWRDAGRTYHAVACWAALAFGAIGLAMYALFLRTGDARLAFAAIKVGTFGLLLPVYLVVCHRMVPFFSQCVLPGYRVVRPAWALGAIAALGVLHLLGELAHAYAWLWPIDAGIAALTGWLAWQWQPWRARNIRLLLVLHWAFAWLPLAFALYAFQSAWFAATGEFILGRAPAHALTIGYFGSMLVAMVTRVTQGHSGRVLEMGSVAWACFLAMQVVAVVRIASDLLPDAPAWHAVAGIAWLLAFAPWVARNAWIYLTPRADGKPG
ncbi:MAG TPA: NnrS family protein, partial [Xanthomonadales bacterium]|nr:NnrS family protein [Xanthomonadales bacterium]